MSSRSIRLKHSPRHDQRPCNPARRLLLGAGLGLAAGAGRALAPPPPRTILLLGDSLSAEYGLDRGEGWGALLQRRLHEQAAKIGPSAREYIVANASISGETTRGGRSRLGALLATHRPAIVILELGANDGLRGLPIAEMKENLAAMIDATRKSGAATLLIGMQMPPNFGAVYVTRFAAAFSDLARERHLPFVPFLLAGFADQVENFQADTIHPKAAMEPRMLDNVWPVLSPMLRNVGPGG